MIMKQHSMEHRLGQFFNHSLQQVGQWLEQREQLVRQKQQLLNMDDHMLQDIGLSRADAEQLAKTL
mgnify:CR=1 FL=1